jgi:predicted Zn-dependent peptidase
MVITGRQLDLEKSLARLAAITPEQLLGLAEKILSREPVIGLLGPDAENLGRCL